MLFNLKKSKLKIMNGSDVSNESQTFPKKEAFPFTLGEGLEKVLLKIGYKSNYDFQNKKIKIQFDVCFVVNKNVDLDCSISIQIRPDNIKKKHKSSFHKCIIGIINDDIKKKMLDKERKYYFVNLPQDFIANVNIDKNREMMNEKFEQLFLRWINQKNIDMIEYLNNNPDLCKKTIWNKLRNMTYKQLLDAYFISAEFEKTICNLQAKSEKKNKKVSALYIENYINHALSYTDFYTGTEKDNYLPSQISPNPPSLTHSESIHFHNNHEENPIHIDEEEPIANFSEHSFGFREYQPIEEETNFMDEEYDSRNEKMICSDNEEKMNESFEKKNYENSFKNFLNDAEKKFM